MFKQSGRIRDYVFPLATVEKSGNDLSVKQVLGTAFFIGNQGFALTAKHVITGCESQRICGMLVGDDNGWVGFDVIVRESHPTEDVALIKLAGSSWRSFFRLSNTEEHASCKYRLFGYPDDTTQEMVQGGRVAIRPDLVYNEGYIRRRYNGKLPSFQGTSFFELSEVAGTGVSGAPVLKINSSGPWDVIGIYVGEKLNDRATSVSYAVREESFRQWSPQMLGKTVLEESQNTEEPSA
ncbi:serine protease [Chromobacterium sp. S0633]|uniref:S1 family peptidase n=1 Tax=Chromobacterium sp. S0633 TaxID=2957805 RepID=UPI0020A08F69|nr:serine protease [Chromobacterium sp. S0633]MCP1289790.1 serine protease [Chromobacterium sp. S0633]